MKSASVNVTFMSVVLGLAAIALGCSEASPAPDPVDAGAGAGGHLPYEGVAFPSRRAPLPAPPGGLALVANARSDTLSVVEPAAGDVLVTLPVGRDPVTTDGPVALTAHAASGSLYVVLAYQDLHIHLHASGGAHVQPGYVQRLALADLSVTGEVEIPEEPRGLAISGDGARLVTAHFSSPGELAAQMTPDALDAARGRLSVIDTGAIETVFSESPASVTACIGARAVALSEDGKRAFVACFDEDAIAVVDLGGDDFTTVRIPVGPNPGLPGLPAYGPSALTLSPDGSTLLFVNELTREVRALDVATSTLSEANVFVAQGTPVGVAANEAGGIYLLTRAPDSVLRLPASLDGPELDERPLASEQCETPVAIALSEAGRVLVACTAGADAPGRVVAIDSTTLALISSDAVGTDPRALVAVPGGAP